MLNLLFITAVLVFIIDLSGFIQELSKGIWKALFKKVTYKGWIIPKPFSCSLCMTFWVGILYLILTHTFSFLMLGYVALLAFLTPVISTVLLWIKDVLVFILDKLYKLIS